MIYGQMTHDLVNSNSTSILLVMGFDWHQQSASSQVLRALFERIPQSQFEVLTTRRSKSGGPISNIHSELQSFRHIKSWRLQQYLRNLYSRSAFPLRHGRKLFAKRPFRVVMGVNPDLVGLRIAVRIADDLSLPLVVYLHDMISASKKGLPIERDAVQLENQVFGRPNTHFFVLNEGMKNVIQRQFDRQAIVLPHIYCEQKKSISRNVDKMARPKALFSGQIYLINDQAVLRLAGACVHVGFDILVTSKASYRRMVESGIPRDRVHLVFSEKREDYLKTLQSADIFLVGLNWPDETAIGGDELSTIFPTKMTEYFAAGRPILVHAPQSYFISEFCRNRRCGILLNGRDPAELERILSQLLSNWELAEPFVSNGLSALEYFSPKASVSTFLENMSKWSQMK